MKRFTKPEKIAILKLMRELIQERVYFRVGLCFVFRRVVFRLHGLLDDQIESLESFGFVKPDGADGCWYWWDVDDTNSRIKAIDQLIAKLQK